MKQVLISLIFSVGLLGCEAIEDAKDSKDKKAQEPLGSSHETFEEHDSPGDDGGSQEAGIESNSVSDDAYEDFSSESYQEFKDNGFVTAGNKPLSSFSIDVDTASYSNLRQMLLSGRKPPKDAVRVEEMINYFDYEYAEPNGDEPFSVSMDMASTPWNPDNRLLRIGIKGKDIAIESRPKANLVFLLDVSGSMGRSNKLPLLKEALIMLTDELRDDDRVAIVVYAGSTGVVLEPTSDKQAIISALDNLRSGGSTAGAAGINLAYQAAESVMSEGSINRVILATDGDFNVGVSSDAELVSLIEEKAATGIDLSVLAFGTGNLNDSMMEKISNAGNGNYYYIDSKKEAQKVLVEQMSGTLLTIAKDVKIQIEFNPAIVQAYRLIGYENRLIRDEDFNDDTKDAGDIGAGHRVTALYELILETGTPDNVGFVTPPNVDPLVYTTPDGMTDRASTSNETVNFKLRFKKPGEDTSSLIEKVVVDSGATIADASDDFRFAAAVANFAMFLRDSDHKGDSTIDSVRTMADGAKGADLKGYRNEFISLIDAYSGM